MSWGDVLNWPRGLHSVQKRMVGLRWGQEPASATQPGPCAGWWGSAGGVSASSPQMASVFSVEQEIRSPAERGRGRGGGVESLWREEGVK